MTARKTTSQPKPAEPVVDLGARPVTYWFPSIKLANGDTVRCEHQRYGHESQKAAEKCARSLLALHGSGQPATPALDKLAASSQPKPAARKLRSGAEGRTQLA